MVITTYTMVSLYQNNGVKLLGSRYQARPWCELGWRTGNFLDYLFLAGHITRSYVLLLLSTFIKTFLATLSYA